MSRGERTVEEIVDEIVQVKAAIYDHIEGLEMRLSDLRYELSLVKARMAPSLGSSARRGILSEASLRAGTSLGTRTVGASNAPCTGTDGTDAATPQLMVTIPMRANASVLVE